MPLKTLVAGLLLAAAAAASTHDITATLETQLAIEERLLAADQESHRQLQEKVREGRRALDQSESALESALRVTSPDLQEISRLDRSRAVAAAALRVLEDEAQRLRDHLRERIRRRAELRTAVQQARRGDPRDPVSGDWALALLSPPVAGTMSLRLDGVLLAGSYALADGRTGSLKGTFVNGRIRLERVDSKAGFEGTFDGTLDAATAEMRGAWTPTELALGGPGVTAWSARRAPLAPATREP